MADQVALRDGTAAWVWPLLPTDRARLVDEFAKLSPESRRHRFLVPVMRLSEEMLRRLVDDVDGVDHVALVLMAETPDGDLDPVGIARMVRYGEVPDLADLAVTVRDDWQGRGVATALLGVLVTHRPAGVTHVLTSVFSDNAASLAMLSRLGPTTTQDHGSGTVDVVVDLDGIGPHGAIVEGSPRLHPALAKPSRAHLQARDLVCVWPDEDGVSQPCGRSPWRARPPNRPASR